ncbi:phage tail length tape measure family protein [Marinovum sp.]|uniref:phage tail length tape measure family protein n=1 Tax=Marinovum sp. TaxID=2024839 RepID=UPI002B272366|nr:phage tail length tape measure family protein [Marinovum sp.]
MTFKVSLTIDADGKAAVQEVKRVEQAQRGAAKASDELGRKSRTAAGGVSTLGGSASGAGGQVDEMADANRRAAGSLGNLVAQGNDVLTMLIAGQDPMQLAIQQGTQINQVWGQMGVSGKGAFKAIGGALMSMLSPINLITIGSIAAAGAMASWFASGEEEAASFEDAMSDLEAAMSAYADASEAAEVGTDELRAKFGEAVVEVRRLLEEQREAARRDMKFQIKAVIETDLDESALDLPRFDFGDQRSLAKDFDLSLFGFDASARRERQSLVNAVLNDYAELARAAEGSVSQQVAAVETLIGSFTRAAQASGEISKSENDRILKLQELLMKLRELQALEPDQGAIPTAQREAYQEYYQSRIQGEEFLQSARDREAAALEQIYGLNSQTRIESDANVAAVREMLGELESQVERQRLIAQHGEDSAEVAAHRAAAERAVLEETLATYEASEALTEEARATLSILQAISGIDVSSGIWDGASAASAMAANLGAAVAQMNALRGAAVASARVSAQRAQNRLDTVGDPAARAGGEAVIDFRESLDDGGYGLISGGRAGELAAAEADVRTAAEEAERLNQAANAADTEYRKLQSTLAGGGSGRRGRSGGRGASAAQKERDAVADLIGTLEDQLAILRETDPIQKEMLRNREVLKAATDAERAAVRDLIEAHADEEEALERKGELTDFLKSEGYDLFTSATQGVDALTAAANRAVEALADMVFQAILLGEGPLAGLFGGTGLLTGLAESVAGSLLGKGGAAPQTRAAGGIVGEDSALQRLAAGGMVDTTPRRSAQRPTEWRTIDARAAGGMIYGKGGGTSDDNLTWTSNGEYVVNARSTARNRGLLERINAGEEFPALAQGGMVGGGGSGGGGAMAVSFTVENRSSAPVAGEVQEVAAPGGGRAYKMVLADMVGDAMATPGGGARRQLRQGYGIKPRGTRR